MNLTSLLTDKTILLSLDVQTKEECIDKMAESMLAAGFVKDKAEYVKAVLAREELSSTGVGFGVAIPHGKSNGVAAPGLAYAKLAQPIDWQSLDGSPVSIVFLIGVPEEKAGNEHLQILAALSRKLIHEEFRNQLLSADSPEQVIKVIENV